MIMANHSGSSQFEFCGNQNMQMSKNDSTNQCASELGTKYADRGHLPEEV